MRHASVGRLANSIYGTVLTIGLITAYSAEESLDAGLIAAAVVVASTVFALAHVQAELLAYRYTLGHALTRPEVKERLWHGLPMVEACLLPALALVLGGVGVYSDKTAADLAVGVGVAQLAAWGIAIGRREQLGTLRTVGVTGVNVALGLVVVALKATIH